MQLLERLVKYYGAGNEEEVSFINRRIGSYTEKAQEELFEVITAENGKCFGFPDLKHLKAAFASVTADGNTGNTKTYSWRRCGICGCEFDLEMSFCPGCYQKGERKPIDSSMVAVTKSPFPPPKNVVYYNKLGLTPMFEGDVSCYDCQHKGDSGSGCPYFGKSNYDCNKRSECPCANCCMRYREQ